MDSGTVSVRFYGGVRDGTTMEMPDPPPPLVRVAKFDARYLNPATNAYLESEVYRLEWYILPGIPGRYAGYFTEAYSGWLRAARERQIGRREVVTMWALAHRGRGYDEDDPVTEEEISQLKARYCSCWACDYAERLGLMRGGDACP